MQEREESGMIPKFGPEFLCEKWCHSLRWGS